MTKIFVSYVTENLEQVRRLAATLEALGMDVWFDRSRLRPGHRWADEIRSGILSGDFFIACFSEEYSSRPRSYMNEELTIAIEELRQRPFDRAWFIPVLLSNSQVPAIPIGRGETLAAIHRLPLYSNWDEGMSQLISVVDPRLAQVQRLISDLNDSSARKRIRAADDLGKIGHLASSAVAVLAEKLNDHNETVRAAAADALGHIRVTEREVIVALLRTANGQEFYSEHAAVRSLVRLGDATIPVLTDALDDDMLRSGALAVLKRFKKKAAVALPKLIHLLDDPRYRAEAALVIGSVGPEAKQALSHLLNALAQRDFPEDQGRYTSPGPREALIRTLGDLGDEARDAVPHLIESLASESESERRLSAIALGKIGPHSKAAVPALVSAIASDHELARWASEALVHIGDPAAIAPLSCLLATGETRDRIASAIYILSDGVVPRHFPCTDISSLYLCYERVVDSVIVPIFHFKNLQSIDLSGSGITDAGMEALTSLELLEALLLSDTGITDSALSSVARMKGLTELDISNTKVTDAGLAKLQCLEKLEKLRAVETRVTVGCLMSFNHLPELEVALSGSSGTVRGLQSLRQ